MEYAREDAVSWQPTFAEAQNWLTTKIAEVLTIDSGSIHLREPFAAFGLESVDLVGISGDLEEWTGQQFSPTLLYEYPTIEEMARFLSGEQAPSPATLSVQRETRAENAQEPVAIIGMACRFPGSSTPEAFWDFLQRGGDAIGPVPEDRWDVEAYYDPDRSVPGKMYTRAGAFLSTDEIRSFDARFFGISPREARRMDPQQRLLLEVAWEALERAGYAVPALAGSQTGIFIGVMNTQDYASLQRATEPDASLDDPYFAPGSASSVFAGRLAYLLDVHGPALTIDTACSSSLTALHLACQSLRRGECDLAVVGGVHAILWPETLVSACKMGMLSVDGHCKTFDASADGFGLGEGCGVVVLKRLSAAQQDGNPLCALLRGSAVNQDGRSNGLTAPNPQAQQAVLRLALADAGIAAEQIGYIEAHGSGTALGDPLEAQALLAVFGEARRNTFPLIVGSVKTNIGHLAGAAGMAGLLKTVLALQHGIIPPHLHVTQRNEHLPSSELFQIPAQSTIWPTHLPERYAGVSSFGWSGTNAHVILQAAPACLADELDEPGYHLLPLSARTEQALRSSEQRLLGWLRDHPALALADLAYTLQVGRPSWEYRRLLRARNYEELQAQLATPAPASSQAQTRQSEARPLVFLLPGLGEQEQTWKLARALYEQEPAFVACFDRCADILTPLLDFDVRTLLSTHTPSQQLEQALRLQDIRLAHPFLFTVEYALARVLMEWGARPQALLGYSLGEYVAACLAGVFTLEDALALVAGRARLIAQAPAGALLAVMLSAQAIQPYLSEGVSLAADNAPATCVVTGLSTAIEQVERRLRAQGVASRRVEARQAFHSAQLAFLKPAFIELACACRYSPPALAYLSNVTGTWVTPEQAVDPTYWAEHLCQPVQFSRAIKQIAESYPDALFLEVGAGQALRSFVLQHPGVSVAERCLTILPGEPGQQYSAREALWSIPGQLWQRGATIIWPALASASALPRQRLCLPPYPFERQHYWTKPLDRATRAQADVAHAGKRAAIATWFYAPMWEELAPPASPRSLQGYGPWLIFADAHGLGSSLVARLRQLGETVYYVTPAESWRYLGEYTYGLRPAQAEDYHALWQVLRAQKALPHTVIHYWGSEQTSEPAEYDPQAFQESLQRGFYSLLTLAQTMIAQESIQETQIVLLTGVREQHASAPVDALLQAASLVISQEYPALTCRHLELVLGDGDTWADHSVVERVLRECTTSISEGQLFADGRSRRTQVYRPVTLASSAENASRLRREGVYLITGGLGNLGLTLAAHLGRTMQARLALVTRSAFPARRDWSSWLEAHDEQDKIARQIRQLQLIEQSGGQVLIAQADVADEEDLRAVLAEIQARWGTLHGVIHAAGFTNREAFALLPQTSQALCQLHFRAKVMALHTLKRVLGQQKLDFCLLCSSISAQLGGLGFLAYAAANRFMDAFAHQQQALGAATPWISVNWDTWQLAEQTPAVGSSVAVYSMTEEEALRVFDCILAQPILPERLLISTGAFADRLRQWVKNEPFAPAQPTFQGRERASQEGMAVPGQRAEYLRIITTIWGEALGTAEVGLNDNFFDLGGNSLIGLEVINKLKKALKIQVPAVALFEAPTIQALLAYLLPAEKIVQGQQQERRLELRRAQASQTAGSESRDIALVAMSGRFPGADSIEEFWENLRAGVESVTRFSKEELLAAGTDPALLARPDFVAARPILSDVTQFDAAFFGYSPREAAFTDPQHRLFLETCWEALERAGYDPQRYAGLIGVFAGANISTYLLGLIGHPEYLPADDYQMVIGNDKDALTTTVSYKLNLKGPSFAVQTFCSTSLVALHLACQSLRQGECDIALAGGVSVRVPTVAGYVYQEGGMESADGHCRAFDAQASGTLFGDGVGVVVLKRLADALADGDQIVALIKGSAINNDGALKVSYSAPSVTGQAQVVEQALRNAGVGAESISYVEAHGTGTELGDPIEVAALGKAFRQYTEQQRYCALGSVKTNLGHLDRAAGISGLIKTALALQHREIPPSLHFTDPNPEIDFAHSPFYVNTRLTPWEPREGVRRAGINSLGMGGTNVHVVLEEAPDRVRSGESRSSQVLLWSAHTPQALEAQTEHLLRYLEEHPDVPLADIAYTLQVGRRRFAWRRMLVCGSYEEALAGLRQHRWKEREEAQQQRGVAWLIAGMGEQFPGMGQELYLCEARYREALDEGLDLLRTLDAELVINVRAALLAPGVASPVSSASSKQKLLRGGVVTEAESMPPAVAHAAMFLSAYAHAQLLLSWGLRPRALLGYSLGEYVAACLAGVFSLEDALKLVVGRAKLLATVERGEMLAVMLPASQIQPYLSPQVSLGAVAAPHTCVLSGTRAALADVETRLLAHEVAYQRVTTTHALHSAQMESIRPALENLARQIRFQPPQLPYLSNVTGTWISAEEACDPGYWGRHLCQTVRLMDAIGKLLAEDDLAYLEVGRGLGLGSFVRQHADCAQERFAQIVALLPIQGQERRDQRTLVEALGSLWLLGCTIDWDGFAGAEKRQRLSLPTYPFERQRYWIDVDASHPLQKRSVPEASKKSDLADWFQVPTWKRSVSEPDLAGLASVLDAHKACWVLFCDNHGVGNALAELLVAYGQQVISVLPAATFARASQNVYSVNPRARHDYTQLVQSLQKQNSLPLHLVHLWSLTEDAPEAESVLERGFYSLLALAQALGDAGVETCRMSILADSWRDVLGNETLCPEKATLDGPCVVIPQEYPGFSVQGIDIVLEEGQGKGRDTLLSRLLAEMAASERAPAVAFRGKRRWLPAFEPLRLEARAERPARLRAGGVYLLTGGLGGLGLALAEYLARTCSGARLVLLGRTPLPARDDWSEIMARQGTEAGVGWQLQQILKLESLGASVMTFSADSADEQRMREAVRQTLETFGALHGVLHLAGLPGIGLMQLKSWEQARAVLAPKVHGTRVLERVLAGLSLDFLVLFSSITAQTGGPGQVDYCAANAFLDAYARSHAEEHGATISINWSEWQWNAWEAGLRGLSQEMQSTLLETRRKYGITFAEGCEAFQRILHQPLPQVIVSSQDFAAIIESSRSLTTDSLLVRARSVASNGRLHNRPALETSYVAPRDPTEQRMADIWQDLLGIAQVGIHDNFFDLGGNSLAGLELISRVRKAFNLADLPTYTLYEAPSVGALAVYLTQRQTSHADGVVQAASWQERSEKRRANLKQRMRGTH